jgi:cysteine desulfurase
VDGVQVLGKIPFSFRKTEIDFLSLSAHKMGGPQGAGALIAKEELLVPLFFGGGQERSLRAGTENIAAIVGFGEAICQIDLGIFEKLEAQHRDLEKELLEFSQGHGRPLSIIGKNAPRLPNTTCLTMPEVPNQSQLIYFDLKGIGVSIGSACSSRTVKPSRILRNMNLSEDIVRSAIRISSGWNTRESDFLEFKEAWKFLFLKHIQNQKM